MYETFPALIPWWKIKNPHIHTHQAVSQLRNSTREPEQNKYLWWALEGKEAGLTQMEQLRALFQQEGNVLVIQQCKPSKRSVAQATATWSRYPGLGNPLMGETTQRALEIKRLKKLT